MKSSVASVELTFAAPGVAHP